MRSFASSLLLLLITTLVHADLPTPLDQPLPAGEVSLIAATSIYGIQRVPGWPKDGLFHYRLYLPDDYYDNNRKYPLMFIASPIGNADMGLLAERLKHDRWLVAMLVESRNRSILWNPNFIAAYDDLMKRVRVQPEMLFCTGFSGAARVCGTYPAIRPGLRGLILQGAAFLQRPDYLVGPNANISVYGTFGQKDPNLPEIVNIRNVLPEHTRRLFEVWDGGHAWAPTEVINRALQWSEDTALLGTDYDENLADMYHWYFHNKLNQFDSETSAIERYRLKQLLQELPERWHLQLSEDAQAQLRTAVQSISATPEDDALAQEVEAYQAYAQALKNETLSRGEALQNLISTYADIAERYATTEYGKQAARRQQSLLSEVHRKRD